MTAEVAIRLRRAEFNRAIATADITAIAKILSPDVILITGTDSAIVSGRKAQLIVWKREFSSRPQVIYSRIPDAIFVSEVEPIAMEHGHWQGVLDGQSTPEAAGVYSAKWRRLGGDWALMAEVFVTLS